MRQRSTLWPIAVLFIILAATSQAQQTLSIEKENALGTQLAADLRRRAEPIANPAVQAYAQRVGNRLSGHPDWHFEVVTGLPKRPTEEPRCFPGAYIFVSSELFLKARNEDEFAGMLAHAIAHVTSHDLTRATLERFGSIPLVFYANWEYSLAGPLSLVEVQRKLELEADSTAIRLMRDAGYNPEALFQFIEREQAENLPKSVPLPQRENRLASLRTEIERAPASAPEEDFRAIQKEVSAELPPEVPRTKPSLFGSTNPK